MTLEEINKRIKILEPKMRKWKWIVGTSTSGVVMLVGGILMLINSITNVIMLYIGVGFLGVGFLYLVINVVFLCKTGAYQKEYAELVKQKQELELPTTEELQSNKDEKKVLLLKLLDEGKISKEEFDELIK